ncbi:MAG: hypothetical protein KC549_18945, partial [Myxococcales bacterium]|nr:hypothetical protein [Myxococcales bacterium]
AEARPAGLPCLVGRALIVLGRMARKSGDGDVGLVALEEALQVAEQRADCHLLTAARLETLWSLVQAGRLAEADVLARRVLTTRDAEPSQIAEARYAVATLAWRRGRIHQAELYGEAAFSGYREAGARTGMAHAACLLGDVARARGAHGTARDRYHEGLALLDAAGGGGRGLVLCNLGQTWLAQDDRVAARAAFIEARQEAARGTDRELRAVVDFFLLVCDALAGRWRACDGRAGVFLVLRDQTPEADVVAQAPALARMAEAAGSARVADAAWNLAEQWLFALGRDAEARAIQAERLTASQARARGLFVRPPTREPSLPPLPRRSEPPKPMK